MKLIVGLGNPGEKYENNRHNAGYMLIDALASKFSISSFKCFKTKEFMNESGKDVRHLSDFYKVSNEDLYVVYDDLDIPLGNYNVSFGKSPRVHNGINSVIEELGTEDFWHVRIGIENRTQHMGHKVEGKEYVLENFSSEEKKILEGVVERVVEDLCGRF